MADRSRSERREDLTPCWKEERSMETLQQIIEYPYFLEKSPHKRWIFRGVTDYRYGLESTLDRAIARGEAEYWTSKRRWRYEATTLHNFKRRAQHYLPPAAVPAPQDFLEWLSLIRHFGGPSRLLDFSYSFFVATYFAVQGGSDDAGVYCIDHGWLTGLVARALLKADEYFQRPNIFWKHVFGRSAVKPPRPVVIPVRPFRSNERIHVQQGLFLCPTDVGKTFLENLRDMTDPDVTRAHIVKLKIPGNIRGEVIRRLYDMNISAETLYPGLDGFTATLGDLAFLTDRLPSDVRLCGILQEKPHF